MWQRQTDLKSALPTSPVRSPAHDGRRAAARRKRHASRGCGVTDTRMPQRWISDTRFTRLSGDAFKLFTFGLMFSVANRREGLLLDDDLPDLPRVNLDRASELERAGLWVREGCGWRIAEHAATQTSIAELDAAERARIAARDRKARQRQRERDEDSGLQSRVTSQARPGQERPGQANDKGGSQIKEINVKDLGDWPEVAKPGSPAAFEAPQRLISQRPAGDRS